MQQIGRNMLYTTFGVINLQYTELQVAAINQAFRINNSHLWLCVQIVAVHWSTVIFAVIPSWWPHSMVESFITSKNDYFIMTDVSHCHDVCIQKYKNNCILGSRIMTEFIEKSINSCKLSVFVKCIYTQTHFKNLISVDLLLRSVIILNIQVSLQ